MADDITRVQLDGREHPSPDRIVPEYATLDGERDARRETAARPTGGDGT